MFFQGNEKYNCATYLRLSRSDGDQQESNSIKNQRALLNDYMGKHPELHKFDEYVDATDIIGLKQNPTNGRRFSPIFLCIGHFSE